MSSQIYLVWDNAPSVSHDWLTVGPRNTQIIHDLRFRLPFADNSQESVRAYLCLHRLPYQYSGLYLADWIRVLEPGGCLTVIVPDLEWYLDLYRHTKMPDRAYFLNTGLYGENVSGRSAFYHSWFPPQLSWWGCLDCEMSSGITPLLSAHARKRSDISTAPAILAGSSLDNLPASPEQIANYQGYEEWAPPNFAWLS